MYSFPDLKPVCCSMSSSNCCFLTGIQISPGAGQVVWHSHFFQNFPSSLWSTRSTALAQGGGVGGGMDWNVTLTNPKLPIRPSPPRPTSLSFLSVSLFLFCRQLHLCNILPLLISNCVITLMTVRSVTKKVQLLKTFWNIVFNNSQTLTANEAREKFSQGFK